MAFASRSGPASAADSRVGAWTLLRPVGAGGLARVFLARHDDGREAALKILRPELAGDQEMIDRLRAEVRATAAVRHEHVVETYEAGEHDGLPFLACEYMDGGTLRELMVRCGGRLPPPAAAGVLAMLLLALQATHRRGLLHRDVKPGNVLLRGDGTAKLGDFGLARTAALPGPGPAALLVGTPAYMSPEQIAGGAGDARSDLFSAGIVLHELLAGRHPFAADDDTATLLRIAREDAPSLFDEDPALPAALERLATRLLAREPAARASDASAALAELRRAEPAVAEPRAPVREALADPRGAVARWRSARAAQHLARADALRAEGPAQRARAIIEAHRALLLLADPAPAQARLRSLGAGDPREPATDERVARLEAELQRRPANAAALRQLAGLYAAESRFVQAASCWKRLLRLSPEDAHAARRLKELLPEAAP